MALSPISKNCYISSLKLINDKYYQQALEYQKENPFNKFNHNNNIKLIIDDINDEIIRLLQNILNKDTALDVTFCKIIVLIQYATHTMHKIGNYDWRYPRLEYKYIQFIACYIISSVIGKKYITDIKIISQNDYDDKHCILKYLRETFLNDLKTDSDGLIIAIMILSGSEFRSYNK